MIGLVFKILVAHAVADFWAQPDAMAKGKNRNRKPDYVPEGQKYVACWPYWLTSHALINGGAVYLATGSLAVGIAETIFHWVIDFAKCENLTNPHQDQMLHLFCKIVYVFALS